MGAEVDYVARTATAAAAALEVIQAMVVTAAMALLVITLQMVGKVQAAPLLVVLDTSRLRIHLAAAAELGCLGLAPPVLTLRHCRRVTTGLTYTTQTMDTAAKAALVASKAHLTLIHRKHSMVALRTTEKVVAMAAAVLVVEHLCLATVTFAEVLKALFVSYGAAIAHSLTTPHKRGFYEHFVLYPSRFGWQPHR